MFEVYVKNINRYPSFPEGEFLLFSIPSKDNYDHPFLSMTVNNELGSAGSFEFSIDAESKYANIWLHMRTLVRVVYDGETIFYGRVLTIDRDMFRTLKIHCEGAFTFFMDSVFEGKSKGYKVKLSEYIGMLLDAHNGCMANSPDKKIYVGELPGNYSSSISDVQKITDETQTYGSNNGYKTVKEWLEELPSSYGGFMRIRYEEDTFKDTIGQYGKGNIDLNNRIVIHNDDGTISTEKSFSTNIDGKEVLLPTIINGKVKSEEYAISYYEQTGEYLGKFTTVEKANSYAEELHERQEWYYGGKPKKPKMFLDWMKTYFNKTKNDQIMSVSSNTVDLSDTIEVDNIFTHVIGSGKGWGYTDGTTGPTGTGTGKYTVSVIVTPEGAASAGCIAAASHQSADDGTTVKLFSKGAGEWSFSKWSGAAIADSTSPSSSFKMGDSNVTITARFVSNGGEIMGAHSVNVYAFPRGAGFPSADPSYAIVGTTINLSQTPASGYRFTGWSCGSSSFVMPTHDVTVTANYEPIDKWLHPDIEN